MRTIAPYPSVCVQFRLTLVFFLLSCSSLLWTTGPSKNCKQVFRNLMNLKWPQNSLISFHAHFFFLVTVGCGCHLIKIDGHVFFAHKCHSIAFFTVVILQINEMFAHYWKNFLILLIGFSFEHPQLMTLLIRSRFKLQYERNTFVVVLRL